MSGESVLVLGAQGFLGRAIRRRLSGRYRLLNVDLQPGASIAETERNLRFDMSRSDEIDAMFSELSSDLPSIVGVVDLVAYYDFTNEPDPRYAEVEAGLEYLLKRTGELLPPDAPFIYASSMAALEPTEPGQKLTPESPRARGWAYPRHKVQCEALIEAASVPQPRVELVLAGVYSDWCELVPLFQQIERVRQGSMQSRFYPGPTDRGLTYVHAEDAAAAFEAALVGCRGRTGVHRYLVGEPAPVPYGEIQSVASRMIRGRELKPLRVPRGLARQGAKALHQWASWTGDRAFIQPWMIDYAGEHFELDTSKTRDDLGWQADHDLHRELPEICRRAAEDPNRWRELNEARPF